MAARVAVPSLPQPLPTIFLYLSAGRLRAFSVAKVEVSTKPRTFHR